MKINDRYALFIATALLGVSLMGHLTLRGITAWYWDEPVYHNITESVSLVGYPAFRINPVPEHPEPYYYHPFFFFYALNGWYNLTGYANIETARLFTSLVGVAIVAMAMLITKAATKDNVAALIVGGLMATDGWLMHATLIIKIDPTAVLIGSVGVLMFVRSLQRENVRLALIAGILLGAAAAVKHVAAIFILLVVIHWVLTRRMHRLHLIISLTAANTLMLYFLLTALTEGAPYINALVVQARRTFGFQQSRGLNFGLLETANALWTTYWAFFGTIWTLVVGGLLTLWQTTRHLKGKNLEIAPVTAWAWAAMLVLGGVQLRNPYYLPYLQVPLLILMGYQLWKWARGPEQRQLVALAIFVGLITLNTVTFVFQVANIGSFSGVNALEEVKAYFDEEVPPNAVVVADEPICAAITQPCFRIGIYNTESELQEIGVDIIVVYSSLTQRPPSDEAIQSRIGSGLEIFTSSGWKETITVIRVANSDK